MMEGEIDLNKLIDKSIFIIRETLSRFKNPAVMFSTGKDSLAMLYLIKMASPVNKIGIPVVHIDTTFKFPEIYEFRDKVAKDLNLNLIIGKNEEALKNGTSPEKNGHFDCCSKLKTEALKIVLKKYKFDALIMSIRRDEHEIRNMERICSPRDKEFKWNFVRPKTKEELKTGDAPFVSQQEVELWDTLQTDFGSNCSHVRIHPIIHWTECMPSDHLVFTDPLMKKISEIEEGDMVLSHDSNFHKVINTYSRDFDGNLIKIIPYNLLPITITEEHPVYVAKLKRCENNVYCTPTCYDLEKCIKKRLRSEMNIMNYNITFSLLENGRTIDDISKRLKINDTTIERWINNKHKIRYRDVDKPYFEKYNPKWLSAKDVTKEYFILIPKLKNRKELNKIKFSDGTELPLKGRNCGRFLRLCGYYLSEGYVIKNNKHNPSGIGLCFGSHEKSLIKDADNCIRGVFGLNPKRRRTKNNTTPIFFYSKKVAEFFGSNFGMGAGNKQIPKFIMDLKPEKLRSFIRASIKGDGCECLINGNWKYNYTTISKKLIYQMFLLFTKFGIIPSISTRENNSIIKGKKYNVEPIFVLSTPSSLAMNKIMRVDRKISNHRKRGFFCRGFAWLPIRKVETEPFKGTVYNIEVENSNSYTSNLITVHNCNIWQFLKKENIEFNPLYRADYVKEKYGWVNRRFRSLGCKCCTEPIESKASTIDEIVKELETIKTDEREGRCQDKEGVMRRLRSLGYM